MSAPLTPAQADRRFFGRFTHRYHRIRVAARCEVEAARRKRALTVSAPEGFRAFIGTKLVPPVGLTFVIGILRDDCDTDMDEEDARKAFRLLRKQSDAQLAAWAAGRQEAPRA
jgi:hypothetical protein